MRKIVFTLTAAVLLGGSIRTARSNEETCVRVGKTNGVLLLTRRPVTTFFDSDEQPAGVATPDDGPGEGGDEQKEKRVTEKKVIVEVQSSAGSGDDGQQKPARVRGRMIMIGPDGQRRELELDEKQLRTFHLDMNGDIEAKAEASAGLDVSKNGENASEERRFEERFVIGVQCEEADDVLRKHLKLDGCGLLIVEVREETPASESGMEVDDVIVAVGDRMLRSREDLVAAVLESEGRELDVRLIRAGDEMSVRVTPRKMKVPVVEESVEAQGFPMPEILESGKVALPGVVIEGFPQDPKELEQLVERLQKEWVMNEKEIRQGVREPGEVDVQVEELRKELDALKEEIKELRKAREKE